MNVSMARLDDGPRAGIPGDDAEEAVQRYRVPGGPCCVLSTGGVAAHPWKRGSHGFQRGCGRRHCPGRSHVGISWPVADRFGRPRARMARRSMARRWCCGLAGLQTCCWRSGCACRPCAGRNVATRAGHAGHSTVSTTRPDGYAGGAPLRSRQMMPETTPAPIAAKPKPNRYFRVTRWLITTGSQDGIDGVVSR